MLDRKQIDRYLVSLKEGLPDCINYILQHYCDSEYTKMLVARTKIYMHDAFRIGYEAGQKAALEGKGSLRWTYAPPTETGWYWLRYNIRGCNSYPFYVDIEKDVVLRPRLAPWKLSELIKRYSIEWAGPIAEPEEP